MPKIAVTKAEGKYKNTVQTNTELRFEEVTPKPGLARESDKAGIKGAHMIPICEYLFIFISPFYLIRGITPCSAEKCERERVVFLMKQLVIGFNALWLINN